MATFDILSHHPDFIVIQVVSFFQKTSCRDPLSSVNRTSCLVKVFLSTFTVSAALSNKIWPMMLTRWLVSLTLNFLYWAVCCFHSFFVYLLEVKMCLTSMGILNFCSFVENQFFLSAILWFFFSWNLCILTGDEDSNLGLSTECFSGEK